MVEKSNNYRERVYKIVRKIPRGKVMTYGQIAEILGKGYTPRTVGFALNAANRADVPWQRVINSRGGCSTGKITAPNDLQRIMLEEEGIAFNKKGVCALEEFAWCPENAEDDEEFSLFQQ
ncbi:MAG: MGMT family protein [Pyrinomonadaceae bacterium]